MTQPRHMTLTDCIHELTQPHDHAEHYTIRVAGEWRGQHHTTHVPALMTQLWANDTPSQAVEEGPRPGFASRPAARLDALDTAARIDLAAARWIRDLGEDDHHTDTAATIRQLHALAASAHPDTRRAIEADVRRWWTWARIVTGWDSPAWKPDATCPQCTERGTLRVRLADQLATCTNDACRCTWEPDTIGLLADHIRAESEAEKPVRVGRGPCWCPVPAPQLPDEGLLDHMCPGCGSARCRHAVGARLVESVRAAGDAGRIGA